MKQHIKTTGQADATEQEHQAAGYATTPPTAAVATMPRPHFDAVSGEIVIPTPYVGGVLRFDPTVRTLTKTQMAVLAPAGIKADFDAAYVVAFLADCHGRGLDPYSGEVYLMRYKTSEGPQYVRHIGIYGFLRMAEESGDYEGLDQVLYQGPEDDKWVETWRYKDTAPYAAKVTAYRHSRRPQPSVVLYDEYAPMVPETIKERQRNGDTKKIYTGEDVPAPMWRPAGQGGKATVMLAKVCRASALRLLFPRRFGGFYEPSEVEKTFAGSTASDWDTDEVAEQRRAAYADAQRTVDGAEVGAVVRETITVAGPAAGAEDLDDTDDGRPRAEAEVRALLLAELDAQARILGFTAEDLTRRWSESRGGAVFAEAAVATMTGHVHRYRRYTVDKLREAGRVRLAERYHAAPLVGTLEELFGTAEPWADSTGGDAGATVDGQSVEAPA